MREIEPTAHARWMQVPSHRRARYPISLVDEDDRAYAKMLVYLAEVLRDEAAKRELRRLFGTEKKRPAPRGLGNVLDVFCLVEAGAGKLKWKR